MCVAEAAYTGGPAWIWCGFGFVYVYEFLSSCEWALPAHMYVRTWYRVHSAILARGKFKLDFLTGCLSFSALLILSLSVCLCSSMQYRARDAASRGDKYMLVSFDEPSMAIKVGTFSLQLLSQQNLSFTFILLVWVDGEPHYFYIRTEESSGL